MGKAEKLNQLRNDLRAKERAVVAFSGGVDSSLVAAVAFEELQTNAVAALAVSESLSPKARRRAIDVANFIGIELIEQPTAEVGDERYVENTPSRCYFCKKETYEKFTSIAIERNAVIVDGRNLDDIGDFRPGAKAADEYGVRHPLYDADFRKEDIRYAARKLQLPNWNAPVESCTSSRILTNIRISPELLVKVQSAEANVAKLLSDESTIRVRHLGDSTAMIEVGEEILEAAQQKTAEISAALAGLGYSDVKIGPYQRGSMNRRGG